MNCLNDLGTAQKTLRRVFEVDRWSHFSEMGLSQALAPNLIQFQA